MEYAEIPSDNESEDEYDDPEYDSECDDDSDIDKNQIDEAVASLENTSYSENCNVIEYESDSDTPLSDRLAALDGIWDNKRRKFDEIIFSEDCGPMVPSDIRSPSQIFLCLFSEVLIERIVEQTNLYRQQSDKPFKAVNKAEILKFIGMNIMMGISRLPAIRCYWSSNCQLHNSYISSVMPLNRFFAILSHIHLNDNLSMPQKGEPNYDKLYKLRPLLDMLSENFIKFYKPSEKQAVDESMVKFKGRSTLKQYNPQKPIKRGFKIWVRADEHGFVCEFQVYTGKTANLVEKQLGERVVIDLTHQIISKNYQVYFDNYFTSVNLMIELKSKNILACGTVRKNRKGLPKKQINDKTMKRGDYESRTSYKGISWIKWNDNKPIQFLSNFHDPSIKTTVSRRQKDGTSIQINCPQATRDYNNYMNCVDKADQLKSTYEISRKSKKWWLRIFWHFIDVTVVNSFIIYKQNTPSTKMNLIDFRLKLVTELIGFASPKKRGPKTKQFTPSKRKPQISNEIRFSQARHIPTKLEIQRNCTCCSSKTNRVRTSYMCITCNVPLYIKEKINCYEIYHKT